MEILESFTIEMALKLKAEATAQHHTDLLNAARLDGAVKLRDTEPSGGYDLECPGDVERASRGERTQDEVFDISYIWLQDKNTLLDYREQLIAQLGPGIAGDLHVVQKNGGGMFGLIYERRGTKRQAKLTRDRHREILAAAGLERPVMFQVTDDANYHRLFDVSFGVGPNRDGAVRDFAKVYGILGEGVGNDLVIEKTSSNNFALVYKRQGTPEEAAASASRLAGILARSGVEIGAVARRDDGATQEYSKSDFLAPPHTRIRQPARTAPPSTSAPPPPAAAPAARDAEDHEIRVARAHRQAPRLEREIERYIGEQRRAGRLQSRADEDTAWIVYDLSTDVKLASINQEKPMQLASMVKPAVGLGGVYGSR